MTAIKEHTTLSLFTLLYVVCFGSYYLYAGNYEFIWYVAVLVFFMGLIGATLKMSQLPPYLLWLLSLWGLLHMAGGGIKVGGQVLYAYVIYPFINQGELLVLRYDQFVHAFGFGVAALVLHFLLSRKINGSLTPFWFSFTVLLGAMGLGVVNEIVEFVAVLLVPNGVGGYFNTVLDLIFNTIGALIALLTLSFFRSPKNSSSR